MSKNAINLGLIALVLVVLGCSCPSKIRELSENRSTPEPRNTPATIPFSTPETKKGEYSLSMDKYNKIKVGMPRAEVENTLGGKGTEISSSVGGGVRFSVNKWEGDGFQSIILSFRNDKVMSKSQVGLK